MEVNSALEVVLVWMEALHYYTKYLWVEHYRHFSAIRSLDQSSH